MLRSGERLRLHVHHPVRFHDQVGIVAGRGRLRILRPVIFLGDPTGHDTGASEIDWYVVLEYLV